MTVNRFGLPRDIPDPIRREVRQRCGFGCVICGAAIYQYEHIDPPFSEALGHSAEGIVLLCGACHDRVTRGLLAKETVQEAQANPAALRDGFSWGPFDVGNGYPTVTLGSLVANNTPDIIVVEGDPILSVAPPEQLGAPFQLSAVLRNQEGTEILRIVKNEWQSSTENWDVEVVGPRISIRKGPGEITLVLRADPPGGIVVERLDMEHLGTRLRCSEGGRFSIKMSNGNTLEAWDSSIDGCKAGIVVRDGSLSVGYGGGRVHLGTAVLNSTSFGGPRPLPPRPTGGMTPVREPGRNDDCPCGSGKKYKRCHGRTF